MRQLVLGVFIFISGATTWASNEIVLGVLRQATAENMLTDQRSTIRHGFGLGLKTESESYHDFTIKLGFMYEQRTLNDVFSGVEHNLELKNIDLVTHISYKALDFFSVFAGPSYSVLLSSKCSPTLGNCLLNQDAKKYFVPLVVGLDFTFLQDYGLEIYYESISQEVWEKTFQKVQTYGLNLKYKF